MISSFASEVLPGPAGIFSIGTSRVPFDPITRATAPAATSAGTLSAAGEALHRLPPIEARPRREAQRVWAAALPWALARISALDSLVTSGPVTLSALL